MKGSSVYQGALSPTDSISPAPVSPEHGINLTSFAGLKPTFFKEGINLFLHSSYLPLSHLTVGSSILLMRTTICLTPAVF